MTSVGLIAFGRVSNWEKGPVGLGSGGIFFDTNQTDAPNEPEPTDKDGQIVSLSLDGGLHILNEPKEISVATSVWMSIQIIQSTKGGNGMGRQYNHTSGVTTAAERDASERVSLPVLRSKFHRNNSQ